MYLAYLENIQAHSRSLLYVVHGRVSEHAHWIIYLSVYTLGINYTSCFVISSSSPFLAKTGVSQLAP